MSSRTNLITPSLAPLLTVDTTGSETYVGGGEEGGGVRTVQRLELELEPAEFAAFLGEKGGGEGCKKERCGDEGRETCGERVGRGVERAYISV